MLKSNVIEFEVIDHGIENHQYFQGCGVAFTPYQYVATGCGNDFATAVDDALECMAQSDADIDKALENRILEQGPAKSATVPEDSEDCYYYVSIRYNVADDSSYVKQEDNPMAQRFVKE